MPKNGQDAELSDLADELMRVGWRLRLRLTASLRRRLTHTKLSIGGYNALRVLHEQGPSLMTALAKALGLTPPTITTVIRGLEQDGLVARGDRDPPDRRRVLVKLTRKGRRAIKRIIQARRTLAVTLLQALPADERQQFVRLYAKMVDRTREDVL